VSSEVSELIDVFPTLADLAGLPPPDGVDGSSLVPALLRASGGVAPPPHAGAFALSVYPRCPADLSNSSNFWRDNDCLYTERTQIAIMGLSIRVENWRYSEWRWWLPSLSPDWARSPVGVELYTHEGDEGDITTYDEFEVSNLAGQPQFAEVEAALSAQLRAAYDAASSAPSRL